MKLNDAFILISRASLAAEKHASRILSEYDLTLSQYKFLKFLNSVPDFTVRIIDLQKVFSITHPTAIEIVRSLEKKGFAVKQAASENSRIHYICLTPKGKAMAEKLSGVADMLETETTRNLNAQERSELMALLRKLQGEELSNVEEYTDRMTALQNN